MSDELVAQLNSICTSLAVNEGNQDDVDDAIARIDLAYQDAGYMTGQQFYDRLIDEVKHSPAMAFATNTAFVGVAKRAAGLA